MHRELESEVLHQNKYTHKAGRISEFWCKTWWPSNMMSQLFSVWGFLNLYAVLCKLLSISWMDFWTMSFSSELVSHHYRFSDYAGKYRHVSSIERNRRHGSTSFSWLWKSRYYVLFSLEIKNVHFIVFVLIKLFLNKLSTWVFRNKLCLSSENMPLFVYANGLPPPFSFLNAAVAVPPVCHCMIHVQIICEEFTLIFSSFRKHIYVFIYLAAHIQKDC